MTDDLNLIEFNLGAKGEPCVNCKEREATRYWCRGPLEHSHGMGVWWCEVCVLREQIEHARERAARLPELEAALIAAERRAT